MNKQIEFHAYNKIDNTYIGMVVATPEQLDNLGYVSGPEPMADLGAVRLRAVEGIRTAIIACERQIIGTATDREVASWSDKAAAAQALLEGGEAPQILAEAVLTGEDPAALARAILAKAASYRVLIARITGLRRAAEADIDRATTPEAVGAVLAGARLDLRALANGQFKVRA